MIGFGSKKIIIFFAVLTLVAFQSCFTTSDSTNNKENSDTKVGNVIGISKNIEKKDTFDFSELNKKLLKSDNQKNEEEIRYINLITDFDGKSIRVGISKTDTSFQHLKAHEFGNMSYYIGVLNVDWNVQPHSNLKLLSLNVPMTEIAMMEARLPNDVKISGEQINKLAIVEGYSSGGMIYKANIVAVFEEKPMELLMLLLEKNDIVPYFLTKQL